MDQEWTWTGSGSGPELDNNNNRFFFPVCVCLFLFYQHNKLDLAFNNVKPKDWYLSLIRFDSGQD